MACDKTNYIYVLSDSDWVAVYLAKRNVDTFGPVGDTITFDSFDRLLLAGFNSDHGPRIRTFGTKDKEEYENLQERKDDGRPNPHNMGQALADAAKPGATFKVAAVAYADGVVYVGDGNTGQVHAFVAGHRDESKSPKYGNQSDLPKYRHMRGLTVHAGRLYVVPGEGADANAAALAYVIPRETYGFPEGYHFATLDQAALRKAARGLTRIDNGGDVLVSITSTSATQRTPFTKFDPAFVLDEDGAFWSELELKITSATGTTTPVRFDPSVTANYREGTIAMAGGIKGQAAYTPRGAVNGAAVAKAPIYNESAELGALRLYLAKNTNNELGYLFDYTPDPSATGAGLGLTIHARLTLGYLPFIQ